MTDTKLMDQIQDKRRRVADRILLIQAPILLFLIVVITKSTVMPKNILDFLLLYWFYWIFLKGYRLLQDLSKIDSTIDTDITIDNYNRWNYYKKKSIKLSITISIILVAFVIVSIIFHIHVNVFKNVFLLILFLDITVFAMQRIIAARKYVKGILRIYAEKFERQLETQHDLISLENQLSMRKRFLEGISLGIIVIFIIYYFFDMSLFHYVIYFYAISSLFALSKLVTSTYEYFINSIQNIDLVKTQ